MMSMSGRDEPPLSDAHQPASVSMSTDQSAPRRRSTRDIKRPRFADEIIDGSNVQLIMPSPSTGLPTAAAVSSASPISVSSPQKKMRLSGGGLAGPGSGAAANSPQSSVSSTDGRRLLKQSESPVPPLMSPSSVSSETKSIIKQEERAGGGVIDASKRTVKKSRTSRLSSAGDRASASPSTSTSNRNNKGAKQQDAGSQSHFAALEEAAKWTATDDLALITAVLQVNCLRKVYIGVKFSERFSQAEIETRWYALLYNPVISRMSSDALKQLPRDVVRQVQSNTLYTQLEEQTLAAVLSTAPVSIAEFDALIARHPNVWHEARTARSLHRHWLQMKHYKLLNDQKVLPWLNTPNDLSFSEIEDSLEAEPDITAPDALLESELFAAEKRLGRDIRVLENELPKWQVLTESVTGLAAADFDAQTMAVLRGRLVRYLIRNKEVVLGRNAHNHTVDIDLSLEGPAFKVSRKQAMIKLRSTGEFMLCNDGKRTIYVDGKPLLTDQKAKLDNNAVVEVTVVVLGGDWVDTEMKGGTVGSVISYRSVVCGCAF